MGVARIFSGGGTLFENFQKKFRKLQKCIFSIFFKRSSKPCVSFSHVWTKNSNCWEIVKYFDDKSMEKVNLLIFILENVKKNRAFGNSTIFLHFFRGGGNFPLASHLRLNIEWSRSRKFGLTLFNDECPFSKGGTENS